MTCNFEEPNNYMSRQLIKWTGDSKGEKTVTSNKRGCGWVTFAQICGRGQTQRAAVDDTLF